MVQLHVSETDGVSSKDGFLILKASGKEVARTRADLTAEQAVRSLRVVDLFPKVEFAFAEKKELIRAKATLSDVVGSYVRGKLIVGDTSGFWEATRAKSPVFDTYAPGRDYADDLPGEGWEIGFPKFVLDLDPVHRFRVAVMIERMLYRIADGDMETAGVSRQLSNTFSASDPVWLKLPLIKKAT